MTSLGIIPARYQSSRLPGKPLKDILGKSMIQRVYEQAKKSNLNKIIVATDHQSIVDEVHSFGGEVMMTSSHHISGTDRCLEVFQNSSENYQAIVNIQGDEPFIEPYQINQLIDAFADEDLQIATLAKRIEKAETLTNPNKPKVHFDNEGYALSFDRLIHSDFESHIFYKHIGIYAYKPQVLKQVCQLPPSSLEIEHKLEQWRWLENGLKVRVIKTIFDSYAVDTPADLKKIIERFGDTN